MGRIKPGSKCHQKTLNKCHFTKCQSPKCKRALYWSSYNASTGRLHTMKATKGSGKSKVLFSPNLGNMSRNDVRRNPKGTIVGKKRSDVSRANYVGSPIEAANIAFWGNQGRVGDDQEDDVQDVDPNDVVNSPLAGYASPLGYPSPEGSSTPLGYASPFVYPSPLGDQSLEGFSTPLGSPKPSPVQQSLPPKTPTNRPKQAVQSLPKRRPTSARSTSPVPMRPLPVYNLRENRIKRNTSEIPGGRSSGALNGRLSRRRRRS